MLGTFVIKLSDGTARVLQGRIPLRRYHGAGVTMRPVEGVGRTGDPHLLWCPPSSYEFPCVCGHTDFKSVHPSITGRAFGGVVSC